MSIIQLPAIDDYWKTKTRIAQVADVMPRDRFKMIRSFLHFKTMKMTLQQLTGSEK